MLQEEVTGAGGRGWRRRRTLLEAMSSAEDSESCKRRGTLQGEVKAAGTAEG